MTAFRRVGHAGRGVRIFVRDSVACGFGNLERRALGRQTHRGSMELLEVVTDGQVRTISLTGAQVTIGRGLDNDVVLTGDGRASRSHALLTSIDGVWKVIDRGSTNGTYVNSVRIANPVELSPGIGSTSDRVRLFNH